MGFALKKGAWHGKILVQLLLMIRIWKSAVAGGAGQRTKGVCVSSVALRNVQSFQNLPVWRLG